MPSPNIQDADLWGWYVLHEHVIADPDTGKLYPIALTPTERAEIGNASSIERRFAVYIVEGAVALSVPEIDCPEPEFSPADECMAGIEASTGSLHIVRVRDRAHLRFARRTPAA